MFAGTGALLRLASAAHRGRPAQPIRLQRARPVPAARPADLPLPAGRRRAGRTPGRGGAPASSARRGATSSTTRSPRSWTGCCSCAAAMRIGGWSSICRARRAPASRTLARKVCRDHRLAVIVVDMAELLTLAADEAAALVRVACREAVLQDGAVYLDRRRGAAARALRRGWPGRCVRSAADRRRPGAPRRGAALDGGRICSPARGSNRASSDAATWPQRATLWRRHLAGHGPEAAGWADDLAARFPLGAEPHPSRRSPRRQQRRARRSDGGAVDRSTTSPPPAASSPTRIWASLAVKVEPRSAGTISCCRAEDSSS